MGKIDAVKTIFEIGKIAAETYKTYTSTELDKKHDHKDREIAKLKSENEELKKKLAEKL